MKLLYLDNVASHYRKAVFLLMDQTFDIDYLFGASLGDIKQMDTSLLKGHVEKTQTKKLPGGWNWQPGLINKLFKKYDRYLLIGESRALATWVFCVLAFLCGKRKKIYFWTHGWYGKETNMEIVLKKIYFHLAGGGIFLYGNYARELLIKEGFSPNKLYTIHNSLDYDRQLAIRQQMKPTDILSSHFNNEYKTIIVIGRLTARKRLEMLLDSVRILKSEGQFYNVIFVGDGSERKKLEQLSSEYEICDQVWFYGACYDEIINAELIYNADLCVMPGDIGLTAIHCMSFGTPCITHNDYSHQGPEFEAIQTGSTGCFFKSGDVKSLVESIKWWFSSNFDREEIRKLCYKEIDEQWTPQFQIKVLINNLT